MATEDRDISGSCDCRRMTFWQRVWDLYYDGFRSMTIGKSLWVIILVKLFLIFIVMKILFFPDILDRDYDTDEERAAHVRHELTSR